MCFSRDLFNVPDYAVALVPHQRTLIYVCAGLIFNCDVLGAMRTVHFWQSSFLLKAVRSGCNEINGWSRYFVSSIF